MIRKEGSTTLRGALAAAALAALLPASAAAAPSDIGEAVGEGFAAGQVVVRYEPGTSRGERAAVRNELDAELERRLLVPRLELLELDRGDSVSAAVNALEAQPEVSFAEPNFVYRLATTPNDVQFPSQWPLDNDGTLGTADADIDATEAWSTATGDPAVVVGVVDGGVVMEHEDLDDNIWANPGESGGGLETNGIDDDGNLKIDDHRGWDFADEDNNPTDGEGHGTHVAGTIGAEGNNTEGIAGVVWDTSLMPLRACNMVGVCLSSDIADAFVYAGEMGADVVNASISGTGSSLAQQMAIAAAPETLFVVAAGNNGNNNDASPRFPCNYAGTNLICVGASTSLDNLSSFSNYGSSSVDLAAPGGGTPGTAVNSTSMVEDMNQEFSEAPLDADWATGGTPDTWDRTSEPSELTDGTLTDSPGSGHGNSTDNFARFGPVDLSGEFDCHLRYDLELDIPDPDDRLRVEVSTRRRHLHDGAAVDGRGRGHPDAVDSQRLELPDGLRPLQGGHRRRRARRGRRPPGQRAHPLPVDRLPLSRGDLDGRAPRLGRRRPVCSTTTPRQRSPSSANGCWTVSTSRPRSRDASPRTDG